MQDKAECWMQFRGLMPNDISSVLGFTGKKQKVFKLHDHSVKSLFG